MKKTIIVSIFLIISIYSQVEILTLRTYACNDQTSIPVLFLTDERSGCLTIEFDLMCSFQPNLAILFRFCDLNWNPYNNPFFVNSGKNIAYNLDYSFLPVSVTEAKYHYKLDFPDSRGYVEFPFSGKWKFYITDYDDTSKIYADGKFYVVEKIISPQVKLKTEILSDKDYFPSDLAKTYNLTASFFLQDEFFPHFLNGVELIENRLIEFPTYIDRKTTLSSKYYSWDGNRAFSFTAREIQPGNEYRQIDLTNINLYNSKNVRARTDGIEYSRFYRLGSRDFDGGSTLLHFDDDYADYLIVTFSIRPPDSFTEKIFVTGSFNNWIVSPEYQLEEIDGLFSKTLLLKRGIYDYQYVTGKLENGKVKFINRVILEGNFLETSNNYSFFIFYKDPNFGGYDRIIGYTKIKSR